MTMAHIQRFLDSVQVAQQNNTPRIIMPLNQAQDLALDIGQILAVAFGQQQQTAAASSITLVGGSFTDK
jgi:hypothetical protein